MPLFDETNERNSLTEGWPALELFVDRQQIIRLFCQYLNDDSARQSILYLYGEGGTGKSLLLRFIRDHCLKEFHHDNWAWIESKSDEEFVEEIKQAEGYITVPHSMLDFGMPPRGNDRPQEAFSALLMIRRFLGASDLQFPLYSYACLSYLQKTRNLNPDTLKNFFPAEEMDFIAEIVDVISKTSIGSIGKATLNLFGKHLRERFTLYLERRKLDEAMIADIHRMEPETQLMDELPYLFAEDLNASMALDRSPKRVVLFFDTHEALWGSQERGASDYSYYYRDEWLRRLLRHLELRNGIVVVVSGQVPPRWPEATRANIAEKYLDLQRIGNLADKDAIIYLGHAGLADDSLKQAIVDYARVAKNEVHPLFLGLCADTAIALQESGESLTPAEFRTRPEGINKGKVIVERLLRYVNKESEFAIQALSAARSYDKEIYFRLGEDLHFHTTETEFNLLNRFSFVWRTERRGDGWFQIHNILRRIFSESARSVTQQAHKSLYDYYQARTSKGDTTAVIEAIYHRGWMSFVHALDEWVKTFEAALQKSNYSLCRGLLELRSLMVIQDDFWRARLSQSAARFFIELSREKEALQESSSALKDYDLLLAQNPIHAGILMNKGLVESGLGDLYSKKEQHEDAILKYIEALNYFDKALEQEPDNASIYSNKAITQTSLGELYITLSRYTDALGILKKAKNTINEAIHLDPDFTQAINQKGNVLSAIGDLELELAHFDDALKTYSEAVAVFEELIGRVPDDAIAHNNKGLALTRLGQLAHRGHRLADADAVKLFQQAITTFDNSLAIASSYVGALGNKGAALSGLGQAQSAIGESVKAIESFQSSLLSFDQALVHAPDDMDLYNNKALASGILADLYSKLGQIDEAKGKYRQALSDFKKGLDYSPNSTSINNNKGNTLARMGAFYVSLSETDLAIGAYTEAIAAYDIVLQVAPDDVLVNNNKGNALTRLGELFDQLDQIDNALTKYIEAIGCFENALRIAPDLLHCRHAKGIAHWRAAEIKAAQGKYPDAVKDFLHAVAALDFVAQRAPDNTTVRNDKAIVLLRLSHLHAFLSNNDEALGSLISALKEFAQTIEGGSGKEEIQNFLDHIESVTRRGNQDTKD